MAIDNATALWQNEEKYIIAFKEDKGVFIFALFCIYERRYSNEVNT